MKKILVMKADSGDADYVTSEHEIGKQISLVDFLKILKIIPALKKHKGSWYTGDYNRHDDPYHTYETDLSVEQIELMDEFVPFIEQGIHTITNIRVLTIVEDEVLYETN